MKEKYTWTVACTRITRAFLRASIVSVQPAGVRPSHLCDEGVHDHAAQRAYADHLLTGWLIQSSLRDWCRGRGLPRTASWAIFGRPFGTLDVVPSGPERFVPRRTWSHARSRPGLCGGLFSVVPSGLRLAFLRVTTSVPVGQMTRSGQRGQLGCQSSFGQVRWPCSLMRL